MPEVSAQTQGAYDRGHTAGEISARLAGHDKHFAAINGSLLDITRELKGLNLGNQKLLDQIAADRATAIALAEALKSASHRSWTPWLRAISVFGALGVAVGMIIAIVQVWGK